MLCLYLSGIALVGRILQDSKYGFPLKMELAEAKVAKTRKGCWRIEKTLRHSQGTTAGAAFKGNDVRQTVF